MNKKLSLIIYNNKILKKMYGEAFKLKLLKRYFKAKPQRLEQARASIAELKRVSGFRHRIFFCGVPMHNNMGDQAQRFCIEHWCQRNYPNHMIVALPTWPFYERLFKSEFTKCIQDEDIIIVQSGYCTVERHYDHSMHKFLVKNFPKNRLLIMPQTVNFFLENEGYKTGRIYDKHNHLLFLARDKVSFEAAKRYFRMTPIYLYPDIVTTLIGTKNISSDRSGVLLCIRNDAEKKYSNTEIEDLEKKLKQDGISYEITDTNSSLSLNELIENFEGELDKILCFFAEHEVVITDRFHGTIFSLISNTPVIVLSTNDHKVKTGTEWFSGIYDNAYYNADSLEEAHSMTLKLVESKNPISNRPYFETEYYDKLKPLFENIKE